MRFYCIGDEDTVTGFRLAGVEGCAARTPADALAALHSISTMPGLGIVIITERLAGSIREEVARFRSADAMPLIVEVPDRHGPLAERTDLARLVRRAVGVRI